MAARRALAPLALAGLFATVLPLASADMTAREVTAELFRTAEGQTPDLSGRDLSRLDLANLDFKQAALVAANLFGADVSGANFSGANLSKAMLDRVTLIGTQFEGANLEGASLLRPSAFSTLSGTSAEAPNFRNAKMRAIRMFGRFNRADFSGADLSEATCAPFGKTGFIEHIWRTEFLGAKLDGTRFAKADLTHALFSFASLKGADLSGAILRDADLSSADLTGADVTGADVSGADLDGVILKNAKGVETLIGLKDARNSAKIIR
jgi:uncharacterized protein YjbI with pentapeptide repeats